LSQVPNNQPRVLLAEHLVHHVTSFVARNHRTVCGPLAPPACG
jgi:hypothetical protein